MPEQKLYEVPLDSGEIVFVQPLTAFARQAIFDRASEVYPAPDKTLYEKPLENAPVATLIEAELNPEYQEAMKVVRGKRLAWYWEGVINAGVVVDTPEGRETTIQRYAERLKALRQSANLPSDNWFATVKFMLITTQDDVRYITNAASEALKEEEIRIGIHSFRRDIQPSGLA